MTAPRTDQIRIKVTAREKRQFLKEARRHGLGMAPWLRLLAMQALRQPPTNGNGTPA